MFIDTKPFELFSELALDLVELFDFLLHALIRSSALCFFLLPLLHIRLEN